MFARQTSSGLTFNTGYISAALTHQLAPFRTKLALKKDGFPLYLNPDEIDRVFVVGKKKQSTGFTVGLVIDLVIVVAAILVVSTVSGGCCSF